MRVNLVTKACFLITCHYFISGRCTLFNYSDEAAEEDGKEMAQLKCYLLPLLVLWNRNINTNVINVKFNK